MVHVKSSSDLGNPNVGNGYSSDENTSGAIGFGFCDCNHIAK